MNDDFCEKTEELIRTGRIGEARAGLERLAPSLIPRASCAKVAELYRRAGMIEASIRLLAKFVRPSRPLDETPTERELAEYAISLVKIGAIGEARRILETLDREPISGYYLALTYFPEWNYAAAIPHLEKFVAESDSDVYGTLVAKANLASAYVQIRDAEQAAKLIEAGLTQARAQGHRLIMANFLELAALDSLDRRDFGKTISCLNEASSILETSGLLDELFVRKWLCLVECYREPGSAAAFARLEELRAKARELHHWETLRDLDHHEAFLRRDAGLYHHLFHGTPHLAYRKYLQTLFVDLPKPPARYDWKLQEGEDAAVFDVQLATFDERETGIKSGQLLHRLLVELTSDFYRPVRTASLAARLFTDQHFDLNTMPNRIYQLVSRLKKTFSDHGVGLAIDESGGGYRLSPLAPTILRVGAISQGGALLKIEKLRSALPSKSFTVKEAAESLSCSESSALRIVNSGIEAGLIDRESFQKRTVYKFRQAG